MQTRRWAVVGAAVVMSLTFATAACGTAADDSANMISPGSTNPEDVLVASVEHIKTTTFKATAKLSGGVSGEAMVDPVNKAGTQKTSITVPGTGASIVAELLVTGGEHYAKVTFTNVPNAPEVPSGWMKLDLAQLQKPANFTFDDPDPASLANELFKGLGTVERAGDATFTGTLDLTKGTESGIVNDEVVTELADKASAVPFEAAVDDQGRIASFRILVPARGDSPAETWEVSYSDWGTPVAVEKPADAVAATAVAYEFLNA